MDITLLSINTWKCDGDYTRRLPVLAAQLKESGADIILCQECFKTMNGDVDTLGYLSQQLDLPGYYVPARRKTRNEVDSYSGLGVLTRLKVKAEAALPLPSNAEDGGRMAQLITLEVRPGTTIMVANIHLTHLRAEDLRLAQLRAVVEAVHASPANIRLIGGDFNAQPGTQAMEWLDQHAGDCYVLGDGKGPRATLGEAAIDHIYALPLAGSNQYPSFSEPGVVLNRGELGLFPSDHFGFRVQLLCPGFSIS